ncbi:BlaI/MecI/CopY family transcriptional regulator [Pedobacter sp. KR3-3]|uniref:BlaI/MecI/CopY family transcriptional regulator n=1 Tax=Pedobacter albus TaxID=3113905 RepID=A0ABU7IBS6_9SPHI|nr:BlaI/MecI/CopY family transcriptional regulator [Pedobacter sp. KR3-3]MEE1946804.1 BlaI/MecI/CopY family transcriptional regulator [Pedobacter sp. KR3-3]
MSLSKTEEQLMEIIWKKGEIFMKEIIETYPDPKPATTTIATLLKRMQVKKFVGYQLYGNSRAYFPLIKKSDYFSKHVNGMIKDYFDNSALQFASFFATNTKLSQNELEELKKIVEAQIKKGES